MTKYKSAQESLAEQLRRMADLQMRAFQSGKSLDDVQKIKVCVEARPDNE